MGKKELDGEDAWARQGRERVCLGLVFNDLEINGQLPHLGLEPNPRALKTEKINHACHYERGLYTLTNRSIGPCITSS